MTTYIYTKEQFLQFNERFVQAANAKSISSADILLHNIISNKNIRCGFTPITNQQKLSNGAKEWRGFDEACSNLRYSLRYNHDGLSKKFGIAIDDDIAKRFIEKMGA